jgi:hypothetical protein
MVRFDAVTAIPADPLSAAALDMTFCPKFPQRGWTEYVRHSIIRVGQCLLWTAVAFYLSENAGSRGGEAVPKERLRYQILRCNTARCLPLVRRDLAH